jgi:hypothetical protein
MPETPQDRVDTLQQGAVDTVQTVEQPPAAITAQTASTRASIAQGMGHPTRVINGNSDGYDGYNF